MDLFRSREFSIYARKLLKRHNVPGLAVGVVQGGKMASAAFGKASLDPPREFATETVFCVGSAAKSLTEAAVVILAEDNAKYPQIRFDAPMSSLLPDDFVMPGDDHNDVTVEDILSHRTGMAPHEHSILGTRAKRPDDARSIMRNLRNLSCIASNRSEHIYCNMMYTAITYLIEHSSGMPFSDFLGSNIFNPLDMRSTYLLLDRVRSRGQDHRVATGYSKDKSGLHETHCSDGPEFQGAGQIWSTIDDYLRWIKAMLQFEGPITKDIAKAVTTKRIQQDPSEDESEVESGAIFCNSDEADTNRLMYKLIDEVVHAGSNGTSHADDDESDAGSDSGSGSDADADREEYEEELREELCPGIGKPQPQTLPLSSYTGQYWHPGYHGLKVVEKNGVLFVDATDRSYAFTLTFKHVCDQTKYLAYMAQSFEPVDTPIKADFRLENNKAVQLGIYLEPKIDEYIWFDKLDR